MKLLSRLVLLCVPAVAASCGHAHQDAAASSTAAASVSADKPSAALLADLESSNSKTVLDATKRIAEHGDADTKRAAGPILVRVVGDIGSQAWRDRSRPKVVEANHVGQVVATDAQVDQQVAMYQAEEIAALLKAMAPIGGDVVIALLFEKAEDAHGPLAVQKAAVAALQANPPSDPALKQRLRAASDALALRGDATSVTALDASAATHLASVGVGKVTVSGGAVADVGATVAGMASGFRHCYVKALEEDGSVQGTIHMTADLSATGVVEASEHDENGHISGLLESCAKARVASATFERPAKLPSTVSFPVTFSSQP